MVGVVELDLGCRQPRQSANLAIPVAQSRGLAPDWVGKLGVLALVLVVASWFSPVVRMTRVIAPVEPKEQTMVSITSPVHRLAAEARQRGIRILVEPISGAHFATSSRDPDVIYRVTAYSCTCPGFLRWG